MEQYIKKSTLMAEMEDLLDKGRYHEEYDCAYRDGNNGALYALKNKLDTLEVKEVDLENEIHLWMGDNTCGGYCSANIRETAEHFFELGLKAQSNGMIEALRTEYEKGRADVIADTISWLANVWPQYCSNPNIIDAYKEGVVKD